MKSPTPKAILMVRVSKEVRKDLDLARARAHAAGIDPRTFSSIVEKALIGYLPFLANQIKGAEHANKLAIPLARSENRS